MPTEDEEPMDEGERWTPEKEETAPEFMEPVLELDEGESPEVDLDKGRTERDARDTTLYRERRIVEEVVEEEGRPRRRRPDRVERRAERERRALEREVARMEGRGGSRLRSSLVYKTFYDMVCNRVGVIVAGFGVAMILFTVSYDWLQGEPLVLGTNHWTALIVSLTVYFAGMALEGMRVLSPECEGLEARALAAARAGGNPQGGSRRRAEEHSPIPMVPDEALEKLNGDNGREV